MRKNFALLGATLVVCLVVRPAMAEEADIGQSYKLAALAVDKTVNTAAPAANNAAEMKQPASKPEKIVKKKPVKKRTPERLVAKINLSSQTMKIMVDGKVRHNWKISSGAKGHHTPTGSYKPYYMTSMHYSKKYDNAPMPHSVFYRGGFAVHATSSVRRLGSPASHGCVRLSPGNAKKFFKLVQRYKKAGTRIRISGSTPKSRGFKKRYASAPRRRARSSWDNFQGYGGNYVSYNARRRPAANTRRIRIGRPTRVRRTSHGRIFNWRY